MTITSQQATDWGRGYGILGQNESATGGLLDSKLAGNSTAMAEYGKFQQNPDGYQQPTGVKPLNVADQNPYQQKALYNMGQPSAPIDPRISSTYDQAGANLGPNAYQQYMNPYINDVINANIGDITRSYDSSRNTINGNFAQSGGYGSSAQGVQQSQNDQAQARDIGDMSANLRMQGFNTASGNALNNANAYGNLAGSYQGLDQYGRNVVATDQNRQLAAGNQIQGQNQAQLDAYFKQFDTANAYPYQQTDYLKGVLGAYPTGSTTNASQSGNPYISGIGGALVGNSIGSNLFGGSGSAAGAPAPSYGGNWGLTTASPYSYANF